MDFAKWTEDTPVGCSCCRRVGHALILSIAMPSTELIARNVVEARYIVAG